MLGGSQLKSSFAWKDLGVPVDKEVTVSQEGILVTKKGSSILGYIRKSVVSR